MLIPTSRPAGIPEQSEVNYIATSRGQLSYLASQLGRICQTVHPTRATFSVYGHEIRNLLILACTEVEMHWRGIMVANAFDKGKSSWSTLHYVRLQDAMRLAEYTVGFPSYPWLAPIRPFEGWGRSGNPTADLPWYAANNAVKHNRGEEFQEGTLERAFEAVTACMIILCAQFGSIAVLRPRSELQGFFQLAEVPVWPLSDVYASAYDRDGFEPINYPFP